MIIIRWSFNKYSEILPEELAIGITFYSCTVFKAINSGSYPRKL